MVKSRKPGSLHDHREALAYLPVRVIAFFALAPLYHLAALLDCFPESARSYRHHVSFTALAESLQDLQHVALFNVVLQHHLLVVDAQFVSKLAHSHHEAVCALRRAVALVRSCRRRIGIVDREIVFHVVALEQRQGL